jgi:hypothetical protein
LILQDIKRRIPKSIANYFVFLEIGVRDGPNDSSNSKTLGVEVQFRGQFITTICFNLRLKTYLRGE